MFYLSYDLDMTFPYFVLGALSLRGYMFIKDIVNIINANLHGTYMCVLLVVLKNIPYDLDLMFKQWI